MAGRVLKHVNVLVLVEFKYTAPVAGFFGFVLALLANIPISWLKFEDDT